MPAYYLYKSAQSISDHEVHIAYCSFFPNLVSLIFLGVASDCEVAGKGALIYYDLVNENYCSCYACHTS
jgi:hypothetical protein